jgi:hypothetical protein
VDDQSVAGRVDIRYATMMAFEVQTAWGDDAVQKLKRCSGGAGPGRTRLRTDASSDNVGLMVGRRTTFAERSTWLFHPGIARTGSDLRRQQPNSRDARL